MWAVWAVLILIIILGMVFFAFNNLTQVVNINLSPLFEDRENVPLLSVVFWSFVSGALLSIFLFITNFIKQSVHVRTARRKIKALENELVILRNRPLDESTELIRGADSPNLSHKSIFDDKG
ncbi:MAG: LapA family protein [candidate division Zixibacteria bacterium]|nr:LapA family protein [candidate division Zixibacteria bacterium]MDD5426493.1 LapA family protein [candidate division Zixibacteria bacterium]